MNCLKCCETYCSEYPFASPRFEINLYTLNLIFPYKNVLSLLIQEERALWKLLFNQENGLRNEPVFVVPSFKNLVLLALQVTKSELIQLDITLKTD